MSFAADLKSVWHLVRPRSRRGSHADRLENFYGAQAKCYDSFRDRLLPKRAELIEQVCSLVAPSSGSGFTWVDMGAGTGINLEYAKRWRSSIERAYLVDLCPSLLAEARQRVEVEKLKNVEILEADACQVRIPERSVDLVTFSFSLTMIPDWYRAIEHAYSLLRTGGVIGVVDFYVSRKYPAMERSAHSWATRELWPIWFSFDDVCLSPDHLPYLEKRFAARTVEESRHRLPFLPLVRVPYYLFIGSKQGESWRGLR